MDLATRISAAFVQAIESNDDACLAALFDPAATTWHNFDRVSRTLTEMVAGYREFSKTFSRIRITDVVVHATVKGLVEQHIFNATHIETGLEIRMPCCLVLELRNNLIIKIEEYMDPAPLKSLLT
jgi:ketosteroid isomerase-like protein